MAAQPINIPGILNTINKPWNPLLVANVNSAYDIKVAKISGSFIWHAHPNTDELFYLLSGSMTLEMENPHQDAHLEKGDMFVVPKGVRHRPVSEQGAEIMMIESVGTINTGNEEDKHPELTVVPEDVRGRE
jgi:mannose-6-phosphate isomerase-like protein (cupin superfamily)